MGCSGANYIYPQSFYSYEIYSINYRSRPWLGILFVTGIKTGGTDTVIAGDTLAKSKSTPTTNNTPTTSAMCFERGEGKNNIDSTYVQLLVKGNKVTGEMNWLPFEKDARKGLLTGTQKGDTIRAVWTFKQEGMTDSIQVAFKLDGNNLTQKPFKADAKTGRQFTDDAAGYTIKYRPSVGRKP